MKWLLRERINERVDVGRVEAFRLEDAPCWRVDACVATPGFGGSPVWGMVLRARTGPASHTASV